MKRKRVEKNKKRMKKAEKWANQIEKKKSRKNKKSLKKTESKNDWGKKRRKRDEMEEARW